MRTSTDTTQTPATTGTRRRQRTAYYFTRERVWQTVHDAQRVLCTFKGVNIWVAPGVVCMRAITQLQVFLGRVVLVSSPGVRLYCRGQLNHYKASFWSLHVENGKTVFSYSCYVALDCAAEAFYIYIVTRNNACKKSEIHWETKFEIINVHDPSKFLLMWTSTNNRMCYLHCTDKTKRLWIQR